MVNMGKYKFNLREMCCVVFPAQTTSFCNGRGPQVTRFLDIGVCIDSLPSFFLRDDTLPVEMMVFFRYICFFYIMWLDFHKNTKEQDEKKKKKKEEKLRFFFRVEAFLLT